MKKLNNKGYLTVEIVVASVIAFAMAFFLMDITVKIVNDTEEAYVDTILTTDKALIMKNIKENIENDIKNYGRISNLVEVETIEKERGKSRKWKINFSSGDDPAVLLVSPDEVNYTRVDGTIYKKNLNSKLINIDSTFKMSSDSDYVLFKIEGENIFSDKDYNINIFIYNG